MPTSKLQILGLCGSLRGRSTNRTLLEAAQRLAPSGIAVTRIVDGSIVPHFNADLEASGKEPEEARDWRSLVASSDGLLVSSPEYAAGIPGALKNALDWLVGDPNFYQKPVAMLRASERSLGAQAALRLVLSTMSADIVDEASITVPLLGKDVTPEEVCADEAMRASILSALAAFRHHIESRRERS